MSPKLWTRIVCVVGWGIFSGCGTTMNLFGLMDEVVPPRYPFGGTIIDVTSALQPGGGYDGIGYALAMDIPFSIMGDALMLPITVPHTCMAQYVDDYRDKGAVEPTGYERSLETESDLGQEEKRQQVRGTERSMMNNPNFLPPRQHNHWAVYRQDDNGNVFEVQRELSEDEARRLAAELESHGHKQLYWVTAEDPPDSSEKK